MGTPEDPPGSAPGLSDQKCPRCGELMTPGFLAFGGRVNWVDEIGFADASPLKGETVVAGMEIGFGFSAHREAHRCFACDLVLFKIQQDPV